MLWDDLSGTLERMTDPFMFSCVSYIWWRFVVSFIPYHKNQPSMKYTIHRWYGFGWFMLIFFYGKCKRYKLHGSYGLLLTGSPLGKVFVHVLFTLVSGWGVWWCYHWTIRQFAKHQHLPINRKDIWLEVQSLQHVRNEITWLSRVHRWLYYPLMWGL